MKKKDIILILGMLLCALALLLFAMLSRSGKTAADSLEVYVDGRFYTAAPLRAGESVTVSQEDGKVNVIRMTESGFYMESSTCHNQDCVQQGQVTKENWSRRSLGAHVICLPNRVDVVLKVSGATADPDAPDV